MNSETFERLRGPVAIVLVVLALIVLWPRGAEGDQPTAVATPNPTIVVGEPGGAVLSAPTPTPAPTVAPTVTATPSPAPTPVVTPPPPPDTFSARVMACRDIDGDRCRGEFGEFPRRARAFTALVVFTDARAGDTISVTLTGPDVSIAGGPYTLGGGGDGYYYSRINYGELPDGDYVLIALRNGVEVARTNLRND